MRIASRSHVVITAPVLAWVVLGLAEPAWSLGAGTDRPVPVLMYHVIADPPPGAPFPQLYVSPAEFSAQMRWLDTRGYRAVTLGDVLDAWAGRRSLPPRPVVLTFDDGYRSQFANAFPQLRRRGWPATLNLDLSNLQESWGIRPWMVHRLSAAGWEIAAHSLTHPDLRTLDPAELRREVSGSRFEVERRFGVRPRVFCYPAGRYDGRVVAAVVAAGYEGASTVEPGLASRERLFELKRVRVSRDDGYRMLARRLASLGQPTDLIAIHGALGSR